MKRISFLLTLTFLCLLFLNPEISHSQSSGFIDDFNDNVRDTTKWTIGAMHDANFNSQVQVAEQGQQLQITTPAGVLGYSGYVTASTWDFTNARASVEVIQTVGAGNDTVFALGIDANNRYRFVVENGSLYFQYKVGGSASNSTNVTYSATQHKFWRFRHDIALDQIVFETSADGTNWTVQRTVARQFSNTALKIEIDSGSWAMRSSATTAIFDNFKLESNSAPPPASDDPVLPQQTVNTTYPVNTGATINVPTGGNLQAAIDSASPGDTITLQPGATYLAPEGGFKLRNKSTSNTSWIIIRSASTAFDSTGAIPPGTRVVGTNTAHASQMPKILSQVTNSPAIAAESSAHHYRLVGLDVGMTGNVVSSSATIDLGTGGETSTALMPSFIIIDRCYVHGNDVSVGPYRRGIALQGISQAVIESHVSNYHDSSDSQAIWGSNGQGPFKIYNNYLEASGENIMFGGQDPAITNMVPADIEIKRNLCTKRLSWRNVAGVTVKNLFELKNARRVLIDGNIFENTWVQAQDFAILIKSSNQEGGCYWCVSEHVTFSNNIVRHAPNGLNILARERPGTQYPEPIAVNHVKIYNTLFHDIGPAWGTSSYGKIFLIQGGASYVKIMHVTAEGSSKTLGAYDPSDVNPNLTFQDNIVERGSYGLQVSDEGIPTLNNNFGPLTTTSYRKTLLVNTSDEATNPDPTQVISDAGLVSRYPFPCTTPNIACTGSYETFVASTWGNVGFIDRANGNYRLASTSAFKGKASDGKDIGIDLDAIEAAIGSSSGGGGGSPGVLMSDDFNDNVRDTTKWTITTLHDTRFNSQVQVAEQTQQLKVTTPTGVLGYSGYVTASTWDFTNARASVEVIQTVGAGNDTVFALGIDANNRYRFVVEDGVLYFQYKVGGGSTSSTNITFSATQHRFWRFRHNPEADQIMFETSADGLTWTVRRTVARQFANTALKIEIDSGSFVPSGNTTTAIFDNFKLER